MKNKTKTKYRNKKNKKHNLTKKIKYMESVGGVGASGDLETTPRAQPSVPPRPSFMRSSSRSSSPVDTGVGMAPKAPAASGEQQQMVAPAASGEQQQMVAPAA